MAKIRTETGGSDQLADRFKSSINNALEGMRALDVGAPIAALTRRRHVSRINRRCSRPPGRVSVFSYHRRRRGYSASLSNSLFFFSRVYIGLALFFRQSRRANPGFDAPSPLFSLCIFSFIKAQQRRSDDTRRGVGAPRTCEILICFGSFKIQIKVFRDETWPTRAQFMDMTRVPVPRKDGWDRGIIQRANRAG